jgi:hypothetical protein
MQESNTLSGVGRYVAYFILSDEEIPHCLQGLRISISASQAFFEGILGLQNSMTHPKRPPPPTVSIQESRRREVSPNIHVCWNILYIHYIPWSLQRSNAVEISHSRHQHTTETPNTTSLAQIHYEILPSQV